MDVAHGHMDRFVSATKYIAEKYGKDLTVIAGVIATYEGACALFESGADAVRVGVGPGSICTTRIMTGHGVPQITAICEAKKAAEKYGKTIIADGGAKNSGDIVKALAAGASAVTLGNLLAGTDEAPGEIIEINGKEYKEYNGSTSKKEKVRQIGKYSQDKNESYTNHTEGVEALVPYKGPLQDVIESLLAGIRSGFSYSGAINLEALWKNAEFIRVTPAGIRESNAHDVILN
ncbi:MAG: Inosine-5'-monophosphate dehydrogenase [candidate division WWE3 bacterium GW2011_GWA2_42_9]|nr:MAG: Inosine-5'-monophosphate dehydrogenase [candidate division WWE3 bacterium GW2011_GWA2_42_9]